MTDSIGRLSRVLWLLAASVIVALAALVLTVVLYYNVSARQTSDLKCVTDWANQTAARADRVLNLSTAKNKATDDLFRAVARKDAKAFSKALNDYLSASNDYNNALHANPLPPSPQLQCGHKAHAGPTPVVVTKTAPGGQVTVITTRPAAARTTATRTMPVPQPTTFTVPGQPQPGRTVTVTRTRTVTRTVTRPLPPCFKNLTLPPCTLNAQ